MNDAKSGITLSGRQSMLHSLPVSLSLGSVALKSEKWKIMDAAAAQAKYDKQRDSHDKWRIKRHKTGDKGNGDEETHWETERPTNMRSIGQRCSIATKTILMMMQPVANEDLWGTFDTRVYQIFTYTCASVCVCVKLYLCVSLDSLQLIRSHFI